MKFTAQTYARLVVAALMRCKGFRPDDPDQPGYQDAYEDSHRIVTEAGRYYSAAWEAGDDPKVTAQFLWECDVDLPG